MLRNGSTHRVGVAGLSVPLACLETVPARSALPRVTVVDEGVIVSLYM